MAVNYSGRDYLLYVGTTAPSNAAFANDANYSKVGLLVNLQFSRTANAIEKSNKDDGRYTSWLPGRRIENVSGTAIFDHTEDTGQAVFQTAFDSASGTIYWLITTVNSGDEEFYGSGILTNYTVTFNDEEPSTIEFEIQSSGASTQAAGTTS